MTVDKEYQVTWSPPDLPAAEDNAVLVIQLTSEGIIADIFVDDEHVATWAQTAEELVESTIFDEMGESR